MSRPSKYTVELAAAICERIVIGDTIRTICADDDMPSSASIFLWLSKYPDFSEQYTRAREAQAEAMLEEVLEIADDSRNDFVMREVKKGLFVPVVDKEAIARSKLRVDSRFWAMQRMAPKRYGAKINNMLTDGDGKPLQNISDAQIAAALNNLAKHTVDDGSDLL